MRRGVSQYSDQTNGLLSELILQESIDTTMLKKTTTGAQYEIRISRSSRVCSGYELR
jgi:hypothetical protein